MKLRIVFATLVLLGICSGISMQPAKGNLTAKLSFGGGGLPTPCQPPSGAATQGFPCLFTK